jgi:uncharacterized iron-regulated protein
LELTKDLHKEKQGSLILGAEMFETDDQLIRDEYLSGTIKEKNFKKEAKIWPNYETDYRPLVNFAKENNLEFIATNVPRRYASVVHKGGFEALEELSDPAKALFAPLPINYDPELPGYKGMLEMMGGMGHANDNLPKAQAIKDATMAHFILQNFKQGKVFIHYNGGYHSKNSEGIVWYLNQQNKDLKILCISAEEQPQLDSLNSEFKQTANFILAIPETMTKTY